MAEPQQCSNVLDAVADTAVVGIELVGAVGEDLDGIIARALRKTDLVLEVEKGFKAIAEDKLKKSLTPTFTEKEAIDAAKKVATGVGKAAGDAVLNEVKKTPQYRDLEAAAKKVVDSLACSPVGVFVNENKTWLYIVGAGAVVAGGVAMYVARSGDEITQPILSALGTKSVSFKPIGSLEVEIGAGDLGFKPKEQLIEGKLFANIKWKKMQVKFEVTAKAVGSQVTTAGKAQVIIPIKPGLGFTAAGTYDQGKKDYSLAVGVDISPVKGVKIDLFGGYGNPLSNPAVAKPNVFQDIPGRDGPGAPNQGLFLGGSIKAEW